MTSRTLSIFNAVGCLLLTGVVIAQWRGERVLDGRLAALRTELGAAKSQAADEAKHRAALERDITVLKESIEATQQAAESSALVLADKDALATRLQAELDAAREQVAAWEAAIQARDERIRSLDADLSATRKRLDEAIANLKTAGAR